MALASGGATRSFRGATVDGRPVLLAGGAGHPTGRGRPEPEQVDRLRAWVAEHWSGAHEVAAWSAQDYVTPDHLPLVGSLGGITPDVHLATGFNKWGLTSGVAAALAITGTLLGARPAWADPLYERGWTGGALTSLARFQAGVAMGGAQAAARLAAPGPTNGTGPLRRGCGSLPVCTHLGGPLRWNAVEQSLDCPLHGSRFTEDGEVLEGPATRALPRLPGAAAPARDEP